MQCRSYCERIACTSSTAPAVHHVFHFFTGSWEAREQREADALLAVARERLAKVDCDAKKLEEAAKPLLSAADPDKFPTPLTVQESCETLSATVTQSLSEAKASIREQQEKLANWSKGPMFEAKRDLAQMSAKVQGSRPQHIFTQ